MTRKPRQTERAVQTRIVHLLRSLGGQVYVLGTTRRRADSHFGTMMTAGLPDCLAFLPARGLKQPRLLAVECKAPGGRLRVEQATFRAWCLACRVAHVVGGVDDVIRWLVDEQYLRADQVAHHHVDGGR